MHVFARPTVLCTVPFVLVCGRNHLPVYPYQTPDVLRAVDTACKPLTLSPVGDCELEFPSTLHNKWPSWLQLSLSRSCLPLNAYGSTKNWKERRSLALSIYRMVQSSMPDSSSSSLLQCFRVCLFKVEATKWPLFHFFLRVLSCNGNTRINILEILMRWK